MVFEEFVTPAFISTVGFPIVVTLYLMMRIEKVLKENTKAISDLTIAIQSKFK